MREDVLRLYFTNELPITALAEDLRGSVTQLDRLRSTVTIEDMRVSFLVNREHIVMLCDSFLEKTLDAESLSTLAFGLMASDHFEFHDDDDVVKEVISDWSAPEINFPLNDNTITMHRNWLTSAVELPLRRSVESSGSTHSQLVSVRDKVAPTRPRTPD